MSYVKSGTERGDTVRNQMPLASFKAPSEITSANDDDGFRRPTLIDIENNELKITLEEDLLNQVS